MSLVLSNKGKGMQSSSEQPLVGEERYVTTRITAAKETRWNPAVGDLFESQGQCRVPFLDLFFIFLLKKSTGNSQGLIRLSNNSVSRAMCKERKQIMSTSLDSIR